MLRRILIVLIPVTALVGFFGWYLSKHGHYVDPAPAIEIGTKYYDDLKTSRVDDAFELYSDEFKTEQGEQWRNFMKILETHWGALASVVLDQWTIAPLNGRACLALFYTTQRAVISAKEQLAICPTNNGRFEIIGHSLNRLDTNQSIRWGKTMYLTGVSVP